MAQPSNRVSPSTDAPAPGALAWRTRLWRLWRMALKECRETIRDRRTIVTLVLMPLLLYPLLALAFQKFLATSLGPADAVPVYFLCLESDEDERAFTALLARGDQVLRSSQGRFEPLPSITVGRPGTKDDPQQTLEKAVSDGHYDVGAKILERAEMPGVRREGMPTVSLRVHFYYREGSAASKELLNALDARCDAANDEFVGYRFRQLRLPPEVQLPPARMTREALPSGAAPAPFSLAALVPLVLILMTITGAVYPAIDLTAGERERGTLETLVAAPVPRLGLLLAKYVAVLFVAVLTACVHLLAMTITVWSVGLGPLIFGKSGVSPLLILQVLGLLLLFASFFSAVLLTVSSFARSFKEAQAYLIPLMLAAIAPGLLSLQGGLELSGALSVTPLVNIVLLGRDLFEHKAHFGTAVLVVASTGVYAIAALAVAARIFGTDAILYGSQGTWSDLLKRPKQSSAAPTVAAAMLCLAVCVPALFVLGSWVMQSGQPASAVEQLIKNLNSPNAEARANAIHKLNLHGKLIANGMILLSLFAGLPLVTTWLGRVRMADGLALRARLPAILGFLPAVILGFCLWPLGHELLVLLHDLGFARLHPDLLARAQKMVAMFQAVPPGVLLFGMAFAPALAEELFFRGFLFSALAARRSPWFVILTTAVLFGLMHLVTEVLVVRLVPTMALGVVLGWLRHRTGSIWPGVVLHFCHNALLVMAARYQEGLARMMHGVAQSQESLHLPGYWIAAAAAGAALGIGLTLLFCRAGTQRAPAPGMEAPAEAG
ncbi:MAG: CPBP family intramembrane metalloprotease [Planctomycetia bacterium]|nr:CPBP family intramembrane metalloprotease [Planctomycetia bacterium]